MRHPIEINRSTGILTSFPSTTTFVLVLGADSPWEDYLDPGTLRLSAGRDLTFLFVTHACILACDISSIPYRTPSTTYTTLLYHPYKYESVASVLCLAPLHFRRSTTRPVSYYALFQGVAASKPTSWLSLQSNFLLHLA
jgi:hypothetical protein